MTDGPDLRAGLIRTTTAAWVTRDNDFDKDMAVVVVVCRFQLVGRKLSCNESGMVMRTAIVVSM